MIDEGGEDDSAGPVAQNGSEINPTTISGKPSIEIYKGKETQQNSKDIMPGTPDEGMAIQPPGSPDEGTPPTLTVSAQPADVVLKSSGQEPSGKLLPHAVRQVRVDTTDIDFVSMSSEDQEMRSQETTGSVNSENELDNGNSTTKLSKTDKPKPSILPLPVVIFGAEEHKWILHERLLREYDNVVKCEMKFLPADEKTEPNKERLSSTVRDQIRQIQSKNCIPLLVVTCEGVNSIMKETVIDKFDCKWVCVTSADALAHKKLISLSKLQIQSKNASDYKAKRSCEFEFMSLYPKYRFLNSVVEDVSDSYDQLKSFVFETKQLPQTLFRQHDHDRITVVVETTINFNFVKRLKDEFNDVAVVVSHTTRPQMLHERDGIDHYFITSEDFNNLIADDRLMEYVTAGPHRYGITKNEISKTLTKPIVLIPMSVTAAVTLISHWCDTRFVLLHPTEAGLEDSEVDSVRNDKITLSNTSINFDLSLEIGLTDIEKCYQLFKDELRKGHSDPSETLKEPLIDVQNSRIVSVRKNDSTVTDIMFPLPRTPSRHENNCSLTVVVETTADFGFVERLKSESSDITFAMCHTTRPRMEHEQEGVDYYFISKKEFTSFISAEKFLGYAAIGENYFGIAKTERIEFDDYPRTVIRTNITDAIALRKIKLDTNYILVHPSTEGLSNPDIDILHSDMSTLLKTPLKFDKVLEVNSTNRERCFNILKDTFKRKGQSNSSNRDVVPGTPNYRKAAVRKLVSVVPRDSSVELESVCSKDNSVLSPMTRTSSSDDESECDDNSSVIPMAILPSPDLSPSTVPDPEKLPLPVVIFGAPGAGKWTLQHRLALEFENVVVCRQTLPWAYGNDISRPVREIALADYFNMVPEDFIGWDPHTPGAVERKEVLRIQRRNCIPVLDVTSEGAKSILREGMNCKWVYVSPPDEAELLSRNMMANLMVHSQATRPENSEDVVLEAHEVSVLVSNQYKKNAILNLVNEDLDVAYDQLKAFVMEQKYIPPRHQQPEIDARDRLVMLVETTRDFGFVKRIKAECANLGVPVSHTTRPRKDDEINGVDYHFVTEKEFRTLALNQEFLEFALIGEYFFGMTKAELTRLSDYPRVLMTVDVTGAVSIKKVQFGTRFILLLPSANELDALEEETLREDMVTLSDVPFFFDMVLEANSTNQEHCYERFKDSVMGGNFEKAMGLPEPLVYELLKSRTGKWLRSCHAMKADHFPSGKVAGFEEDIEGVPNYRQVAVGSHQLHTFHGMAQPTVNGLKSLIARTLPGDSDSKLLIVNLREEKVMYINGKPFCLKNLSDLFHNTILLSSTTREKLEFREAQLRVDILNEASKLGNMFIVHDELPSESTQFAACGSVYAYYEKDVSKHSVKTVKTVIEELQKNFNIDYLRLPVADEKAPRDQDFDTLKETLLRIHEESPSSPIFFNCQLGRGRTTTALLLAQLALNPPMHNVQEKHNQNITLAHQTFQSVLSYCESTFKYETNTFVALHHLHDIIGKCAHIQNLYDCVAESVEKCNSCTDGSKKKMLWYKVENYAKRYYYLAMAALYMVTSGKEAFACWMDDSNAWVSFFDTEIPHLEGQCNETRSEAYNVHEASGTFLENKKNENRLFLRPNPPFVGPVKVVVNAKKLCGLAKRYGYSHSYQMIGKVVAFSAQSMDHPTYGCYVKRIIKFTSLLTEEPVTKNRRKSVSSVPTSPSRDIKNQSTECPSSILSRQISDSRTDEITSPIIRPIPDPVSPFQLTESCGFLRREGLRESAGSSQDTTYSNHQQEKSSQTTSQTPEGYRTLVREKSSQTGDPSVSTEDHYVDYFRHRNTHIQDRSWIALCTAYVFWEYQKGPMKFYENKVCWMDDEGNVKKTFDFDSKTFLQSVATLKHGSNLVSVVVGSEFLRHVYGDVGVIQSDVFSRGLSVLTDKPLVNNLPGDYDVNESIRRLRRLIGSQTQVVSIILDVGMQHSPLELVNTVLRTKLDEKEKTIEHLRKQIALYEKLL